MTVGRRSEINSNAAILVPHGVEVVINGADLNKDARTKTAPKTDEALKTGQTVHPGWTKPRRAARRRKPPSVASSPGLFKT